MKILLITDTWKQINGVTTSYKNIVAQWQKLGDEVDVIYPELFFHIPIITYPELKLPINLWKVKKMILKKNYDHIHIMTEGVLCCYTRKFLTKKKIPYTTSFHTFLPEYFQKRLPFLSLKFLYRYIQWFHKKSHAVFVKSGSLKNFLKEKNIKNTFCMGVGTDTEKFKPNSKRSHKKNKTPIFIFVGRVAIEKNIEDFLKLDLVGKKIVVGDGPKLKQFRKNYPDTEFVGYKLGKELTDYFSKADVFIFPSKTDTLGLVILESLACGTPVAAYPVIGPKDIIENNKTGILSHDLKQAAVDALLIDRKKCREAAVKKSWQKVAKAMKKKFLSLKK